MVESINLILCTQIGHISHNTRTKLMMVPQLFQGLWQIMLKIHTHQQTENRAR
jgi:hypothetical protein